MSWKILLAVILSGCAPRPTPEREDPVKLLAEAMLTDDALKTEYRCLYTCRPQFCAAFARGMAKAVERDLSSWAPGDNFRNAESFYVWIGVRHFINRHTLKAAQSNKICRGH